MKFEELGLAEPLLRAVAHAGLHRHHQIQAAAIPPILKGRDVLGCADRNGQNGRLRPAHLAATQPGRVPRQRPRTQDPHPGARPHARIGPANPREFSGLRPLHGHAAAVVYGGVGQSPQVRALNGGVDILIATPGPPAGPDAARLRGPVARGSADPRRGRSDARHGLYPRSAADRGQSAAAAANAALFRHPARGHSHAWPTSG